MQTETDALTEIDVSLENRETYTDQLFKLQSILTDCLNIIVPHKTKEKEFDDRTLQALKTLISSSIKLIERNGGRRTDVMKTLSVQPQGDYMKLLAYIHSLCDSLENFHFFTGLTNEHDMEAVLGDIDALREALKKQMDDLKRDDGRPYDSRFDIVDAFVVRVNRALLQAKKSA